MTHAKRPNRPIHSHFVHIKSCVISKISINSALSLSLSLSQMREIIYEQPLFDVEANACELRVSNKSCDWNCEGREHSVDSRGWAGVLRRRGRRRRRPALNLAGWLGVGKISGNHWRVMRQWTGPVSVIRPPRGAPDPAVPTPPCPRRPSALCHPGY